MPPPPSAKKTPDTHAMVAAFGVVAGTLLPPTVAAIDQISRLALNAPLDAVALTLSSAAVALGLSAAVLLISRALGIAPAQIEADAQELLKEAPVVYEVAHLSHTFNVASAQIPTTTNGPPDPPASVGDKATTAP